MTAGLDLIDSANPQTRLFAINLLSMWCR